MSFFEDASLVLIPSAQKTSKVYSVKPTDGTGDLTFTRSNDTATRVNSAGLIEKVRTNVITYSQAFDNALWSKDANGTGVSPSVTANNATAPDGTMTADTIVFNAGAGTTTADSSVVSQAITITGLATASFYARVTSGTGQLVFRSVAGATYTTANLTTTWQRFSATESGSSGFFDIGIRRGLANEPINASVTVQIWGAQLEAGDIATDYIATTSAAVSVGPVANVPRLDYLNSSCPRLLLEPQRTNLNTFSEQFNNAAYTLSDATITANAVTSPDGYTSADKINETTANAYHIAGNSTTLSASTVYTISFFAKAAERSIARVLLGAGNFATQYAYFNLSTGVTTTDATSSSMVNYGNGWYRCIVTSTSLSSPTGGIMAWFGPSNNMTNAYNTYAGTAGNGIYVWGAQVEAGAYATSYIPTLGAAVTRGADACSKTGISSLIGQTEGTLFVEVTDWQLALDTLLFSVSDGSLNNYIQISTNSSTGNLQSVIFAGGGATALGSTTPTAGQTVKIAVGYKLNDYALYVNGVQIGTLTSKAAPSSLTRTDVGSLAWISSGLQPRPKFAQALLFPTRLSNADLAALTA